MPGPANLSFGNLANQFALLLPTTNASVGANTTAERTFTLQGVRLGVDIVLTINKPTHQAGLGIVNARISADNTIAITYMNNTGSGITPTSETYPVIIGRVAYDSSAQIPAAIA
jgi:hypothetical protein